MSSKTIFITGAASGIGRATAILFASKGWFVGLYDLDEAGLLSLSREIGEQDSCYQVLDVCDLSSVEAAVLHFDRATGSKMDVLFNNAGILALGRFEDIELERHHDMFRVNVGGVLNCIYACLTMLKNTTDAHIINMSSASALHGVPEHSSYSASKFAVRSLTESLNIEFEEYGITVGDLMPSYVATPMVQDQSFEAGLIRDQGVHLTAEDIAAGVWETAHNSKVHLLIGATSFKILSFISFAPNRLLRALFKKALN